MPICLSGKNEKNRENAAEPIFLSAQTRSPTENHGAKFVI